MQTTPLNRNTVPHHQKRSGYTTALLAISTAGIKTESSTTAKLAIMISFYTSSLGG